MIGTALERVAGLTMSLSDRLTSPNIFDEKLVGAGTGLLGLKVDTPGLNASASGLKDGGLEKLKPPEGNGELSAAGLNAGASATGLNAGASGLNTGASGLKAGADTLKFANPSILGLLLSGPAAAVGGLTAGAKLKPEEKDPGLKDAAGLNLNSLASTLSLEIDEREACLL
jgi:hypothetical protein